MLFGPPTAPSNQLRFDWLFLDLNSFFASCEQQLNPALRGRPVVVAPLDTDYTCAIAASYEAKAFGVKTGTPIKDAKRLCPGLVVVVAETEKYVDFHERIVAEVEKHVPVTQVASIDEMACYLPGSYGDGDFAVELARRIKAALRRNVGECMTCSVGLAPNRLLAKIASDMQKPDGLVGLDRDTLPGRLLDLELQDIPGIGPRMEARLHRAGIRTMPALMSCSSPRLRSIWGSVEGERLWLKLRGVEIPDLPTRTRSLGHSHVIAPENRPPERAEWIARRLLLKAATRLRRGGYMATRMELYVRIEKGPGEVAATIFQPLGDSPGLMKKLSGLWGEIIQRTGTLRLMQVGVQLTGLVPAESLRQLELFPSVPDDAGRAEKPEVRLRLSHAMDALNRKFGRDTITLGLMPGQARQFTGTKIAFTRVPKREEYLE